MVDTFQDPARENDFETVFEDSSFILVTCLFKTHFNETQISMCELEIGSLSISRRVVSLSNSS